MNHIKLHFYHRSEDTFMLICQFIPMSLLCLPKTAHPCLASPLRPPRRSSVTQRLAADQSDRPTGGAAPTPPGQVHKPAGVRTGCHRSLPPSSRVDGQTFKLSGGFFVVPPLFFVSSPRAPSPVDGAFSPRWTRAVRRPEARRQLYPPPLNADSISSSAEARRTDPDRTDPDRPGPGTFPTRRSRPRMNISPLEFR